MRLEIFDSITRERLGMIKEYTFVQYSEKFTSAGKFTIKLPFTKDNIEYLRRGNYILFDNEYIGVINYLYKSQEDNTTIAVKGSHINKILEYRVFEKTYSYSGTVVEVSRKMVEDLIVSPSNPDRKIEFLSLSEEQQPESAHVNTQITGKDLLSTQESLLKTTDIGYKIVPLITPYSKDTDFPTNIRNMEFRNIKATDRTMHNEFNNPVVFSMSLNNVSQLEYEEDGSEYSSVAYVAGEGEGSERTVIEVGSTDKGILRLESYVDARDLQKVMVDKTLSDEEYEKLLTQRGSESLEDKKVFTSFSATIVQGQMNYVYGEDYKNGDYVTIVDEQLGISLDVQITEVTKSVTTEEEVFDLTFGYEKSTIKNMLKKKGVL